MVALTVRCGAGPGTGKWRRREEEATVGPMGQPTMQATVKEG